MDRLQGRCTAASTSCSSTTSSSSQQKARTEEEFFHTFNALHAAGAQIVLTSDQPPRDLDGLEDRLRARFEAGLVTELGPPDLATRLTILRKRVLQDGIGDVDEAALELIAARVDESVRALEGALIRVVAFASLTGRTVTAELADEVLGTPLPRPRPPRRAAHRRGDPGAHLQPPSASPSTTCARPRRAARVAWARQVAMYLSRELTDATLPAIGRAFGRNHTTVMHACTQDRRAHGRRPEPPTRPSRFLTLELGG